MQKCKWNNNPYDGILGNKIETLTHATTQVNLEGIMLSEISQIQKAMDHAISFI